MNHGNHRLDAAGAERVHQNPKWTVNEIIGWYLTKSKKIKIEKLYINTKYLLSTPTNVSAVPKLIKLLLTFQGRFVVSQSWPSIKDEDGQWLMGPQDIEIISLELHKPLNIILKNQ